MNGQMLSVVGRSCASPMDRRHARYGTSPVPRRIFVARPALRWGFFFDDHPEILSLMGTLQIRREGGICIGNVQFYFYICFGEAQHPLAMVSLFSLPDTEVLSDSSGTVYLCKPLSAPEGLVVLPVTAILSVVSMFPEMRVSEDGVISETGKFSLMRHVFIELAHFSDGGLFDDDDDST